MAKTSVLNRGLPYYGGLKKKFPIHWSSFHNMWKRAKDPKIPCGISVRYNRNVNGFINFILDIGPIPDGIKQPSVGRIDHSDGYVFGNFKWQEKNENSTEAAIRTASPEKIKSTKKHIKFENLKQILCGLNGKIIIDYKFITASGYNRRKDLIRSLRDNLDIVINHDGNFYYFEI